MRSPAFLLIWLAGGILTAANANARDVVVTVETRDNDNDRPADPLFACTATSKVCKSTFPFTHTPYTGGLRLSTCHHANNLKQYLGRLFGKHHEFSNSFWAYCDPDDEECEEYVGENEDYLDGIAQDLEVAHDVLTDCKPVFKCYYLDQVDAQCWPKDG